MLVYEYSNTEKGQLDLAVRIHPAEFELIKAGFILTGANLRGQGTRLKVLSHDDKSRATDSNAGFVWLRVNPADFKECHGRPMLTITEPICERIYRVVVIIDPECVERNGC